MVFGRTLVLERSIQHQVVIHMTAAQEPNRPAVQQAVQPVTEKLGGDARSYDPGQDVKYGFHIQRLSTRRLQPARECRSGRLLSARKLASFQNQLRRDTCVI